MLVPGPGLAAGAGCRRDQKPCCGGKNQECFPHDPTSPLRTAAGVHHMPGCQKCPYLTGHAEALASAGGPGRPAGRPGAGGDGPLWMGPGRHFIHYFVRDRRLLCFVAIEQDTWTRESWTDRGHLADAQAAFAGWHPQVRPSGGGRRQLPRTNRRSGRSWPGRLTHGTLVARSLPSQQVSTQVVIYAGEVNPRPASPSSCRRGSVCRWVGPYWPELPALSYQEGLGCLGR